MTRVTQQRSFEEGASPGTQLASWDECDFESMPGIGAVSTQAVARDDISQSQMGWLLRTIEKDIIPRLLQAHRSSEAGLESEAETALAAPIEQVDEEIDSSVVGRLAALVLTNDGSAVDALIAQIRARHVALDAIYLKLLAPAARHLGAMWDDDLCDFTQVTVGLWRLQQLMYELSPAFQNDTTHGVTLHRTMLVPVPGSQHTLGLLMVAEFFRRAGWTVWGDPAAAVHDLVHAVKTQWFDIVGFSVGTESHFGALTDAIRAIRKASLNPAITVMVGGPVFVANPEFVDRVGADATAPDAAQAVEFASTLMAERRAAG